MSLLRFHTSSLSDTTVAAPTKKMDPATKYVLIVALFLAAGVLEIGGGWMRKSKASGRDYVSLTLADPQIGPRRIFANLAPVKGKKGRHVILWNARD